MFGSNFSYFSPQVSSLDLLSNLNPDYKSMERLILTNNSLKSLQGLENSWLQRNGPVLLDVRDNFITQVICLVVLSAVINSNFSSAGHFCTRAHAEQGQHQHREQLLLCWQPLVMQLPEHQDHPGVPGEVQQLDHGH